MQRTRIFRNGTRILSQTSMELLLDQYLGWLDYGPEWDGHGGDIFGFKAHMWTNLGRGTSVPYQVIVFTNQWYSFSANFEVTEYLANLVYEIDQDNPTPAMNVALAMSLAIAGFASVFFVCSVVLVRSGRLEKYLNRTSGGVLNE